jgi:hypothetical protein
VHRLCVTGRAVHLSVRRWQVVTGPVRKTGIYAEPAVDVALARRAAAEGTTKAKLIRQAVRGAARGSVRARSGSTQASSTQPTQAARTHNRA